MSNEEYEEHERTKKEDKMLSTAVSNIKAYTDIGILHASGLGKKDTLQKLEKIKEITNTIEEP